MKVSYACITPTSSIDSCGSVSYTLHQWGFSGHAHSGDSLSYAHHLYQAFPLQ